MPNSLAAWLKQHFLLIFTIYHRPEQLHERAKTELSSIHFRLVLIIYVLHHPHTIPTRVLHFFVIRITRQHIVERLFDCFINLTPSFALVLILVFFGSDLSYLYPCCVIIGITGIQRDLVLRMAYYLGANLYTGIEYSCEVFLCLQNINTVYKPQWKTRCPFLPRNDSQSIELRSQRQKENEHLMTE